MSPWDAAVSADKFLTFFSRLRTSCSRQRLRRGPKFSSVRPSLPAWVVHRDWRMELIRSKRSGSTFLNSRHDDVAGPKIVQIVGSHIAQPFSIALIPGANEAALHRAVAARANVPTALPDGSEAFYFTVEDLVVPLCDSLASGTELTMRLVKPPGKEAAPAGREDSTKRKQAESSAQDVESIAAAKLQAIQRGHMTRQSMKKLDLTHCFRKILFWITPAHAKYERGPEDPPPEDAQDAMVHGMAKMSRLATDMANERTLLAWFRTILAFVRTAFATLSWVPGAGLTWLLVHRLSVFMITLLLALSTYVGIQRYRRLAKILKMKDIPNFFSRQPIWPLNLVLGLCVVHITIAVLVQNWFAEQGLEMSGGDAGA